MQTNRADKERNGELIHEKVLEYIKAHGKMPSFTIIEDLTGLSMKTVRAHMKTLKFKPTSSVLRILTNDVLIAIKERATGFEYFEETFEKLDNKDNLEVTQAGEIIVGDTYKKKVVTKRVLPDPAAQKLWLQVMEGFSEKTETKHSGSVGFNFNYVVPQAEPQPESTND